MKQFLFDIIATQPNSDGDFHGGGKYAKKIFFEFLKQPPANWAVYALYDSSKHLDEEIKARGTAHNITFIDIYKKNLSETINQHKINRFYTALPFSLVVYGFNELLDTICEVYSTIHGLRSLETSFPISSLNYITSFKDKLKILAKKAFEQKLIERDKDRFRSLMKRTNVFAVSNHTKYSILSFFPETKPDDITVFYSPDVTEFEDPTIDTEAINFNDTNYFLLVSGNRWLKNNLKSAAALDELFTERPYLKKKVIIM